MTSPVSFIWLAFPRFQGYGYLYEYSEGHVRQGRAWWYFAREYGARAWLLHRVFDGRTYTEFWYTGAGLVFRIILGLRDRASVFRFSRSERFGSFTYFLSGPTYATRKIRLICWDRWSWAARLYYC